jgi:Glycosyl hydrolase family 26
MYWGATISGDPYGQFGTSAPANQSAWDLFERHAGRKIALLNMSQAWGAFDANEMNLTWNRGAIPVVTMGLADGVTLEEIAAGDHDSTIESWAAAAKSWGHPFFLAPWWEMNGGWYPWGRDPSFVAAWRRFHDLVVAKGATNVTWAWISNSLWSDPLSDPAPYYPGDAYVDWTGIDTYNWGLNLAQPDKWINPDQTITPTLTRVRKIAPSKPVLILENASSELGGNKANWIAEMLGDYLPHHPEIRGYMWFNWNFERANGFRADWPIETSAPAQQAFRRGIQSNVFRSTRPPMANLTKVPVPPPLSGSDSPHATDLSPLSQDALAPQVAVAPDGTSTVVWSAQAGGAFGVYARRTAPNGIRGPVTELSPPAKAQPLAQIEDALAPQVAVAPDGTVTTVWIRSDGTNFVVQARRIAADGTLGAIQDLSVTGRDAAEPQVAVAPDGTATFVWKRFNGTQFLIKARRMAADGTLAPTQDLSVSGRDAVDPQVAVAADSTATVVWSRYDGANSVVQERRLGPDGTPSAGVNDLSSAGQNAVQPQVVVAPDGTATVVWVRYNGANTIAQERRISPGGVPEPTTNDLSAAGRDAAEAQLALGPDGSATVVWERYDGSAFVVQSRRVSPAGVPAATTRTLSATGRDAAEPQVSVAPDGSATVIWTRFDGVNYIVQRRGLAADGTPAATTDSLSAVGRGAGFPQLASGARAAVWIRFDGVRDIVQGVDPAAPVVPAIMLSPESHDFGPVPLGAESADRSFQLFNSGSAPLTVTSISVAGADANQFVLLDTGACTSAPLQAGASCEFTATFEPSIAGVQEASIEILSNAASSPDAASLSGTAVAAASVARPAAGVVRVSNSFMIGKPILNRKKGTARLPVTLPGAGTLIAVGSGVSTLSVGGPGTVGLQVKARGGKRRTLIRSGKVGLKITLTFVPRGGEASTQIAKLLLRKAR